MIERGSVGISVMPSAWKAGSGAGAEAWASPDGRARVLAASFAPPGVEDVSPPRAAFASPRRRLFLPRACFSPASSRAARTAVRTALLAAPARERCR